MHDSDPVTGRTQESGPRTPMAATEKTIIADSRSAMRMIGVGGSRIKELRAELWPRQVAPIWIGGDPSTQSDQKASENWSCQAELDKRVRMMKEGLGGDGVTDQYRVYQDIIAQLERQQRPFLRIMVQASAGYWASP